MHVLGAILTMTTFQLSALNISLTKQDWGTAKSNRSVDGNPLTIGGESFLSGLGTHANSVLNIKLNRKAKSFSAMVGVDSEVGNNPASVEFKVFGDGQLLAESGIMRSGNKAKKIHVELEGINLLKLIVNDAGDGINYDHANWANAEIVMISGKPTSFEEPEEKPFILTPKPGPKPKLTGPKLIGVRTGNPVLHFLTATGNKPIKFQAAGLPEGVHLDENTGFITGKCSKPGNYSVKITASNSLGQDSREIEIKVGNEICLTPPMGWNSWNCWGNAVDQQKVFSSAKAMAEKLRDHGWTYINIDDGWQGIRGGTHNAILPNKKFPDIKGLVEQIHKMGLKAGIYSTPWQGTYAGHIGGSCNREDGIYDWIQQSNENNKYPKPNEHYNFGKYSFVDKDVLQWVDWEFDYLKYDWGPLDVEHVSQMTNLLKKCGRDIVYSISNSASFDLAHEWSKLTNAWRTTGDIYDAWGSVTGIWDSQNRWKDFAGPGHWNDPDMLVVGKVGWGPNLHKTKLTPNEQYSHISLWCLLSAPLLLGCDLADLDEFTLNLLTNDEVLAINYDSSGNQGELTHKKNNCEIWSKPLDDGSVAVGLFNRNETETTIKLDPQLIGKNSNSKVRDLWRQKSLGKLGDQFEAKIARHGVLLLKISG